MDSKDYQQLAREAEDKAWAATSDDLRARWLDIAQAWLLLARDSDMPRPIPMARAAQSRHLRTRTPSTLR